MPQRLISDHSVTNIWMCMNVLCDNEEETHIHPDWYQNNGTPVCPECDEDMDYRRTLVDLPEDIFPE